MFDNYPDKKLRGRRNKFVILHNIVKPTISIRSDDVLEDVQSYVDYKIKNYSLTQHSAPPYEYFAVPFGFGFVIASPLPPLNTGDGKFTLEYINGPKSGGFIEGPGYIRISGGIGLDGLVKFRVLAKYGIASAYKEYGSRSFHSSGGETKPVRPQDIHIAIESILNLLAKIQLEIEQNIRT